MKLIIKWRYPEETEKHEHTFHDIDPTTITIAVGFVHFGKNKQDSGWNFPVNHVLDMRMEEE